MSIPYNQQQGKIEVFLDDNKEPIAVYSPPARFELDTTILDDGEHKITVIAYGEHRKKSVRNIKFIVRNGPGIAIQGLKENDVVEGKVSLLVNAYGASAKEKWEPITAETPSPIPSWIWVVFILIVAWAMFYFINQWNPPEEFANTPTYKKPQITEATKEVPQNLTAINGADIYRKSCSSCHQENGQGLTNVFPPLMSDDVVKAKDATEHIRIVLFGLQGKIINRIKYLTPMPAWADQLSDEEVAAVINHERTSWGNDAQLIKAEDVQKVRENHK